MNKVLIIDDDKELCALMKKCIEQEKLSAVTVYNGIEGVRLIDENKDSYSLIILDVIPISKTGYFFSKFIVVLSYSVCFMLLTAIASVFFGMLPGYITFEWNSISYLFKKCIEIAILTAFSILPLLAVAAAGKNYILPVCVTLVYTFLSFILLMVNMYLHPLFTSISDVLSACYPITATFNISGYYSATFGEIIISLMSLCFCGLFSVLILTSKKTIKNK
jgi:hypothetical protein